MEVQASLILHKIARLLGNQHRGGPPQRSRLNRCQKVERITLHRNVLAGRYDENPIWFKERALFYFGNGHSCGAGENLRQQCGKPTSASTGPRRGQSHAITTQILELLPDGLQPRFQNGELRINFLPLPGGRRQLFQQMHNRVICRAGVVVIPAYRLLNV
jgi:hypothetical protein